MCKITLVNGMSMTIKDNVEDFLYKCRMRVNLKLKDYFFMVDVANGAGCTSMYSQIHVNVNNIAFVEEK